MNCLRCNTENEEGVKFCKNCGMDMTYTPSKENTNSKLSDTFLIVFVSIVFIASIAEFVILEFVDNWYQSPTKYIRGCFWILQNLSFILIPLSIKNKFMKIIGMQHTIILSFLIGFGSVSVFYTEPSRKPNTEFFSVPSPKLNRTERFFNYLFNKI
jgi:hypothetical protein